MVTSFNKCLAFQSALMLSLSEPFAKGFYVPIYCMLNISLFCWTFLFPCDVNMASITLIGFWNFVSLNGLTIVIFHSVYDLLDLSKLLFLQYFWKILKSGQATAKDTAVTEQKWKSWRNYLRSFCGHCCNHTFSWEISNGSHMLQSFHFPTAMRP